MPTGAGKEGKGEAEGIEAVRHVNDQSKLEGEQANTRLYKYICATGWIHT